MEKKSLKLEHGKFLFHRKDKRYEDRKHNENME